MKRRRNPLKKEERRIQRAARSISCRGRIVSLDVKDYYYYHHHHTHTHTLTLQSITTTA